MSELLPCPFCGGEVELVGINVQRQKMMFVCGKCNAEVVLTDDVEWNYRHYPPEVQQAVERMKPMKVILVEGLSNACPECLADSGKYSPFCRICGQALDWSE